MKCNFKIILLTTLILAVFSNCDNQLENESKVVNSDNNNNLDVDALYDAKSNLKREFGKALAKSLNESKSLRDLIKNEALKMFDNDYEVLYHAIKNERLENNITVRENILNNLDNKALLNQIEIDIQHLLF